MLLSLPASENLHIIARAHLTNTSYYFLFLEISQFTWNIKLQRQSKLLSSERLLYCKFGNFASFIFAKLRRFGVLRN